MLTINPNLTIAEIEDAIRSWQQIIDKQDASLLDHLFQSGNLFKYTFLPVENPDPNNQFFHMYPGVFNDKLKFIVIPAAYDKNPGPGKESDLLEHIQICPLQQDDSNLASNIEPQEAQRRIDNWKTYHSQWTTAIFTAGKPFYRAFVVPAEDVQPNEQNLCFLALKGNVSHLVTCTADLILESLAKDFYDTCVPVPPFGDTGPTAEEAFFLLELADTPL